MLFSLDTNSIDANRGYKCNTCFLFAWHKITEDEEDETRRETNTKKKWKQRQPLTALTFDANKIIH